MPSEMNLPSHTSNTTEQSQNGTPKIPGTPSTSNINGTAVRPSPSVNTSVAMTVTPASAAVSAGSLSSTKDSPMNHLHLKTHKLPRNDSWEATPSTQGYPSPSPSSVASAVPDRAWGDRSPSPHGRVPPHGAMADAIAASKSPGLIRRLSRGAHNRLRRRTSHQHSMRMRDQSAGPVLVRRRSDSNAASDTGQDVSDLELDNAAEDIGEHSYPSSIRDRSNPLGISVGRTSNASSNHESAIAAAMMSAVLQAGTWVTKHTSKKKKRIKIWLDPNSARVCWHPTNLAKSFFIDDVREVRIGAESRNARDDAQIPDEHEGRWITIVYEPPERSKGRTIKTMHLVMESEMILMYWSEALSNVSRERSEIMNALSTSTAKSERGMAIAWKQVMARKGPGADEVFTMDDARWICKKLEINCSDSAVVTHYRNCDPQNTGRIDYSRYQNFVNSFKGRKDIQNLFRNVNMGTDLDIGLLDFLAFLKDYQHIDVEKDRLFWEGVFDRFAKPSQSHSAQLGSETSPDQKMLTLKGFQNFLVSGYNAPLVTSKTDLSLDRPLNEYFISSSHNTYLLGRQVAGASSVEGYIQALIRGCRCIEIDCWDGEAGRPMVTHGRTMTSKVSFEDCVSTIGKYAFHSTPYPLVVSLEVHCNAEQQKTMVDMMYKYWKQIMVTEPLVTNAISLPSPEELKGRILVKVKAADEDTDHQLSTDSTSGRSRARSLGSAFSRTPSVDRYGFASSPLVSSPPVLAPLDVLSGPNGTPQGYIHPGPPGTPSSSADDSDDVALDKPRKRKTSKIVTELGVLGVYAQGIKYNGFHAAEARTPNHIFSFSENTFDKLCTKENDSKSTLERHNSRYLMRVYPAARRIDSSNFNPLQAWRRGVQMAALNWQTYDVHQQVNEAMFAAGSDRLGYVLKPEELRHAKHLPIADTIPEAAERRAKKGKKIVKFTVDIRSAQRLPRPRNQSGDAAMNPFVEFEMYSAEDKAFGIAKGEGGIDASAPNGASGIGLPLRKRTRIVDGNGFDPIYHDSITMTVETKYPSLIFVRWTVWSTPDSRTYSPNSTLLATFTAKLSSLQQGYRHLPLFNPTGEQYREAKLFVNIKKEAPVPLEPADNAYGIMESSTSPRPEPTRQERSWRSRVFSRNSSQRRIATNASDDVAGVISRTSSMDRDTYQ